MNTPIDSIDFSVFKQKTLLVVGDVMLDRYWHGLTSRISPEAPVPVVQLNSVVERPGGAANVALGVAALGAKVHLIGISGQDEASRMLEGLVTEAGVVQHLITSKNISTITKLRILSHGQQVIRLDNEPSYEHFSEETLQTALQATFDALLDSENIDAVILSDYGKGTLNHSRILIAKAREHNIPVLVDPKSTDFNLYRGATLITPNFKEFEAVVGKTATETTMVEKGQALIRNHDIASLVLTRSEHGMSVIPAKGEGVHLRALARDVHDVTGAGDTVAAVLGIALAMGMDLIKAATLANRAAGIVVGKIGTASVTLQELKAALGEAEPLTLGVLSEEALLADLRISKARGERIVFTNGCFDILHSGHVMYLEQAKRLGDRVIVAVNTDASVSVLKGPKRPINTLENRMAVLAGLKSVDWVVPFSEATPERLIKRLTPHVLVKGGDYTNIEDIVGADHVLAAGGSVKILGLQAGCSTTRIVETILCSE